MTFISLDLASSLGTVGPLQNLQSHASISSLFQQWDIITLFPNFAKNSAELGLVVPNSLEMDSTKRSSMLGGSKNYNCVLTDSRAVEKGETGETGRSLRLACGSVTVDQASQISTKEVIYPYDGPLDTGLIGLEFISDGPLAVEPIEWELMDSRVQEFDHSQLFKAEVEKYSKETLHIQQNTQRTNAT
ncbi:hypothetical protein BCIN_02g07260 [Botrytis cinerea B05.10]|uniref:Uncharacterized protein n=1 Tax=Botryotinia fuckeliana (strain B05.10) TaxID=332648 RepID=A0A384JAK4_BOTFB|nr:hypothetical protein BCIN_02g07260 [Botrytis cinerea B05.10]ATZ47447.1 hypothetical protein BCIN_02g07260 [Botrytis cinerea B05.10]